MKLPLKHIIILVICSLTGIFVYQTYWLTGLYRTMKQEMNNHIKDAMRTSDFNEIVLRVNELQKDNVEHGSVTVSAGYSDDGKALVTSQTISYTDSTYKDTLHTRTETAVDTLAVNNTDSEARAIASSESGLDVLLKKEDSMKELLLSVQQGMHSGVDTYIDINLQKYDSLLTDVLKAHNIDVPHHTLYIHRNRNGFIKNIYRYAGYRRRQQLYPQPESYPLRLRIQQTSQPTLSTDNGTDHFSGMEANDRNSGHFICYLPHPGILLLVSHPDTAETKDTGRDEEQLYQ